MKKASILSVTLLLAGLMSADQSGARELNPLLEKVTQDFNQAKTQLCGIAQQAWVQGEVAEKICSQPEITVRDSWERRRRVSNQITELASQIRLAALGRADERQWFRKLNLNDLKLQQAVKDYEALPDGVLAEPGDCDLPFVFLPGPQAHCSLIFEVHVLDSAVSAPALGDAARVNDSDLGPRVLEPDLPLAERDLTIQPGEVLK